MGSALNLIIARGFDSPIQGMMDSYNNQRRTQESLESSDINQQQARQAQQWESEDRARAEQVAQQGRERQAALQELYGRAEQLASLDPNDPQVQAQWRQIAIEKERITGEGSAFQDIMRPKASASPARPVIVQGPDGPVYADAASAVGKPAYIAPQGGGAHAPPKPPQGYLWVDETNPSAGVKPLPGGPADPAAEKAPAPPKTTDTQRTATGYANRMASAEQKIADYTPNQAEFFAWKKKQQGSTIANRAISDKGQLFFNNAQEWMRAKLRKESGAVIGADEAFQEYTTYFPEPGDTPEVIAQKRVARQIARKELAAQGVQGPAKKSGPTKIQSDADYDALPSGSTFIAPDGSTRRKP